MSFSSKVKDELCGIVPTARHCELAELAALLSACATITVGGDGGHRIRVTTEKANALSVCQKLIFKIYGYTSEVTVRYNSDTHNRIYHLSVMDSDIALKILLGTRLMDVDGSINRDMALVSTVGINNSCCRRAFLRGAFIAGGSVSDPEKGYHLEIVASGKNKAMQIVDAMKTFELDARIVLRRKSFVAYLKEGEQIVDMLNVMGAHKSLMDFENVRVVKEVRNSVNRKFNCEMANINKTVTAAVKQMEDINYIKDTVGLETLDEGLEEIARLRLDNPDLPLKDLGELLSTPVGKSGVNHRLRRISRMAEDLRQAKNPGGMRK